MINVVLILMAVWISVHNRKQKNRYTLKLMFSGAVQPATTYRIIRIIQQTKINKTIVATYWCTFEPACNAKFVAGICNSPVVIVWFCTSIIPVEVAKPFAVISENRFRGKFYSERNPECTSASLACSSKHTNKCRRQFKVMPVVGSS